MKLELFLRRRGGALVGLFLGLSLTPPGLAQNAGGLGVYLPISSELEVLVTRLEKAREAADWDTVLEGLGKFLELASSSEPNAVLPSGGGLAVGLRRAFRELAAALPESERDRYQTRVDSVLDALVARTRAGKSFRHRLLRDYPQARVAPLLLEAAADEALLAGEWRELRDSAGELLRFQAERSLGIEVETRTRLLLCLASLALGDAPAAAAQGEALAALESRSAELSAELREATAAFVARRATLAAPGLPRPTVEPPQRSGLEPQQALLEGSSPPFRLGSLVWDRPAGSSRLRQFLTERGRSGSGSASIPCHAVTRGDDIAYQHVDRLALVDARSGRERWSVPLVEEEGGRGLVRMPLLSGDTCYYSVGERLTAVQAADGKERWSQRFAYDTEAKVLRVSAGPATPDASPSAPSGKQAQSGGEQRDEDSPEPEPGAEPDKEESDEPAAPPNKPGGDAKDRAAPSRPPVAYLSPPVAAGSDILVQVHVRVDQELLHHLVCLDARGELLWTAFLGSAQGGNYLALGGTPSLPRVAGNRVYALTNTGILAAVDARDGALEWICEYPRLTARGKRQSIRRERRWQPNPLLVAGDLLILAPQDSTYIVAVDAGRGNVVWRAPRAGHTVLVGADDKACYLAGTDITAIAHSGERRGQALWTSRGEAPGSRSADEPLQLFGRPFFSGRELLVPTREALLVLSANDGELLSRTLWDFSAGAGNLLLLPVAPQEGAGRDQGGLLAICAPEGLHVYNNYPAAAEAVRRLPTEGTQHESVLQAAKFHLKHLDMGAGLTALREWQRSGAPAPEPNSAVDHLHLDLAETAWLLVQRGLAGAHAVELLRLRTALERTPERRVKAYFELAQSLEAAGDAGGALRALHDALAFDQPATVYSPAEHLRVASAALAREQIRRLRAAAPATATAAVDGAARDALRQAQTKTRTVGAYQEVIRRYPSTPAAREAYLDLWRLFVDAQNYEQAIAALEGFLGEFPGDTETVRVKLLLAGLLQESGQRREARSIYEALLASHPQHRVDRVPTARPGETVEQFVRPLLRDASRAAEQVDESAELRFPVRMAWRSPSDLQAARRGFLWPTGEPPAELGPAFLTQAMDRIALRSLETGLPLWTAHLDLIPGFQQEDTLPPGFRFWTRTGRRAFTAWYLRGPEGPLLVAHDERNLLAIHALTGVVRWHVPFGQAAPAGGAPRALQTLREKLRGVAATDEGVFAVTTTGTLRRVALDGTPAWEQSLDYLPAPLPPVYHQGRIWVHAQNPPGLRAHDALSGQPLADERHTAFQKWDERLVRVVPLPGGRLLAAFDQSLRLLSLEGAEVVWSLPLQRQTIRELHHDKAVPDSCILITHRAGNNLPGLVGVDLGRGKEMWRYEKFATIAASFSVLRDRNRVFVVHGREQWSLLALNLREDVDGTGATVEPLWPNEVPLGHLIGATEGRLAIGGDAVLFSDPDGGVSVYDKGQGLLLSAPAEPIRSYLLEKEDVSCAVIGGRLILLTDGGDCAFETAPRLAGPTGRGAVAAGAPAAIDSAAGVELFEACRQGLADFSAVSRLALSYFRGGDLETALQLLSHALLWDEVGKGNAAPPPNAPPPMDANRRSSLLGLLLDGIKEEQMRYQVPQLTCRRVSSAPLVDGDLGDAWDVATALHLDSPLNITSIPGTDAVRDWEGEEDLSAVLYTGWDEKYFYFALDVKDDVLHPYEKDAENWKGDCLIIGLDPVGDGGFRQNADDQLMTLALTIPKRKKPTRDDENDPDGDGNAGEEEEDQDEDEGRKPAGLFSVKKKDDNSGAVYEVALPWASMTLDGGRVGPPPPGYAFGLSLLLTDDDSGQGATKALSANPCHLLPRSQKHSQMWRFIIPYFFPRVTLE